jgi:hypothetical protein
LLVDLKDSIEERSHEILLQFEFVLGRFKGVFLAVNLKIYNLIIHFSLKNPEPLWKNIDTLDRELFSTAEIDSRIVEIFSAYRSLKSS